MRHATDADLDRLAPFLCKLREIKELVERKRGIFYWRSKSFLHFHEHEGAFYADVRLTEGDFTRMRIGKISEFKRMLSAIRKRVVSGAVESRTSSVRAQNRRSK